MNTESDGHSVHFSHYAAKLERHLLNHGISCHDADLIIEESSVLYFERLRADDGSLLRFLRKKDPSELFVESACKAIKKLLPGAQSSYGARRQIEQCIRRS